MLQTLCLPTNGALTQGTLILPRRRGAHRFLGGGYSFLEMKVCTLITASGIWCNSNNIFDSFFVQKEQADKTGGAIKLKPIGTLDFLQCQESVHWTDATFLRLYYQQAFLFIDYRLSISLDITGRFALSLLIPKAKFIAGSVVASLLCIVCMFVNPPLDDSFPSSTTSPF